MTDLLIRVHTNGVECDGVAGPKCKYREGLDCWLFWERDENGFIEPKALSGEGPFLRCKECLAADDNLKGLVKASVDEKEAAMVHIMLVGNPFRD